ncbi:response regulator [Paenibacillus fonticola]|uniref:response regulator n=1 Tax=Paenibacillus fonticola TaxID=379896 RepID=UPI0003701646|nr:response regulator [Paenibacillus fonticola]
MYSIFLVDDEELELEMMRDYIRWEEMGIYVAGTAVNGRDAVEKIEVIQPDIVLTDVQMPIMNGIDLAKQINARYDWIQLVFLTGHDAFDYVKSALNVGAVGYLLKPLDLSEIITVIEKVKQRCEEVRMKNRSIQVTKSNIFKQLMHEQNEERLGNLVSSFCKLARHKEVQRYVLTLISIDMKSGAGNHPSMEEGMARLQSFMEQFFMEKKLEATLVPYKEGEISVFMDAAQQLGHYAWEDMIQAVRDSLQLTITVAVSEQDDDLFHTRDMFERAKNILAEQFYVGSGGIIYAKHVQRQFGSEQAPPFAKKQWLEAINQLELEDAVQQLRDYFANLIALRTGKKHICDWAIEIIDDLLEHIHEPLPEGYKKAELYHTIYNCHTVHDIEAFIVDAVKQATKLLSERFLDKNAKLVHQVRTYIDQAYHQPITINSLSDQVYLSPNYLRSIFKDKTGMTIHDYLTKIRLDKAKALLVDGSLKVQDIAQMVGYESTSYFISLFLKSQGVTPNEYRKNL